MWKCNSCTYQPVFNWDELCKTIQARDYILSHFSSDINIKDLEQFPNNHVMTAHAVTVSRVKSLDKYTFLKAVNHRLPFVHLEGFTYVSSAYNALHLPLL